MNLQVDFQSTYIEPQLGSIVNEEADRREGSIKLPHQAHECEVRQF